MFFGIIRQEDVRYEALRKRWPGPGMFLAFFELQAIIAVVFSLPFLFASWQHASFVEALEVIGLAIGAASICGEAWPTAR